MQNTAGTLSVVATPIGNLEDITLRALRILKSVDLIAAEDTRHTRKLLTHHHISTPLVSCHRHREEGQAQNIVRLLKDGKNVALVSDAGTPGIADPGDRLIRLARAQDVPVEAVPGPSALTAALSISGRGDEAFLFLGFLPARQGERRRLLKGLATLPHNLVFYEAPHRVTSCLADCIAVLGDRRGCWCRELTKIHEQCLDRTLTELLAAARLMTPVKGESVILVSGAAHSPATPENPDELLRWHRDQGALTLKDAVREVAALFGLPRAEVYRRALALWKEG